MKTILPIDERNTFVILFIILHATSLGNINSASLITLAINIQEQFNINSSISGWILSSYALTLSSFVLISGKIGDISLHIMLFDTFNDSLNMCFNY